MLKILSALSLLLVPNPALAKSPTLDRPFLLFWGPKGPSVCFADTNQCHENAFVETDFATVWSRPHFQAGDFLFSFDGLYSSFPIPASEIYPKIKNGMSVSLSPDQKSFAYKRWVANTEGLCIDDVLSQSPSPRCILKTGAHNPFWVEDNRILYRDGEPLGGHNIFFIHPDGKREDKALFTSNLNIYKLQLSPSGRQIVLALGGFVLGTVDWKTGAQIKWGEHAPGDVLTVALNPDETRFAYVGNLEPYDQKTSFNKMNPKTLWVIDAPGAPPRALVQVENKEKPGFIFGKGYKGVSTFAWSPDGKQIAFVASRDGDCRMINEGGDIGCKQGLYLINSDGTGLRQLDVGKSEKLGGLSWITPVTK